MDILIYVDELPMSRDTLALATLWLECLPAHVTVMMPVQHLASLRPVALASLPATIRDLVTFKAVEDHLLDRICEECDIGTYDLLIVAPAGRSPLQHLVRGSRIGHLVHDINTSTLIARGVPPAIRRILVGVGTGEHALVDVRTALRLAQAFHAELHVIHVVSQVPLMFTGLEHMRVELDSYLNSGLPGVHILAAARQLVVKAGLEAHIHLHEGLVRDELLEEACSTEYDLLVIGAHAEQGWMSLLLDDIAGYLVRNCLLPTLVVRSEPRWI